MIDTTFGFIGFGLIGGSIAKGIRRARPDSRIMAYMRTRSKLEQARQEGVIDEILDGVNGHLGDCDIVFLCTPVARNVDYLARIKPLLKEGALVTDVGSTKTAIHEAARDLGMEDVFVGGHPMAGSEKTGVENATDHLLERAYYIITPTEKSTQENVYRLIEVAKLIGSFPLVLDYREHDRIVAAISHLPHLIASSLVNLVHRADSPEEMMKRLAAGGFKDITRIASSSPEMWEEICMTNTDNIVLMLDDYIEALSEVRREIQSRDGAYVHRMFAESRDYRDSISDSQKGPFAAEYTFSVDIVDEPGAIATLSCILSARGISISNIGINHNRMHGEGALKITFYEKDAMEKAWQALRRYNYELMRM